MYCNNEQIKKSIQANHNIPTLENFVNEINNTDVYSLNELFKKYKSLQKKSIVGISHTVENSKWETVKIKYHGFNNGVREPNNHQSYWMVSFYVGQEVWHTTWNAKTVITIVEQLCNIINNKTIMPNKIQLVHKNDNTKKIIIRNDIGLVNLDGINFTIIENENTVDFITNMIYDVFLAYIKTRYRILHKK